ncbi:regulatory subunit 4 [Musa troglodytarum]|uniref:Regulatory subunit 4 n=1 Tax=Musa troglodytarum TaxID=320322 RepID=A0A9E7I048_9LILI|nr:regulatory subunit 4 [Musa troglodytarum]
MKRFEKKEGLKKFEHHGDKGKKFEPGASKQKSPLAAARLPAVTPLSERCLRFLKLERIKDYLLRRQAEKNEYKVDDLRGSPMNVENLEELIGESHAIVSLSVGPEYHIRILSLVVKDRLERGCAILMHNKNDSVGGVMAVFSSETRVTCNADCEHQ